MWTLNKNSKLLSTRPCSSIIHDHWTRGATSGLTHHCSFDCNQKACGLGLEKWRPWPMNGELIQWHLIGLKEEKFQILSSLLLFVLLNCIFYMPHSPTYPKLFKSLFCQYPDTNIFWFERRRKVALFSRLKVDSFYYDKIVPINRCVGSWKLQKK